MTHDTDTPTDRLMTGKTMDLFIRIGLIGFLAAYCYRIFEPFIGLMLWSLILAVALYPLHLLVARKMGGKQGRASSVLIFAILLGVLTPTALLAFSFADSTTELIREIQAGTLHVPEPDSSVSEWPLIGKSLYSLWNTAHTDLGGLVAKYEPKIREFTRQALEYAASVGTAILIFLVSLILAGILMAHGEAGHASAKAIAIRMAGKDKGEALVKLSTATIRAVAQGVIGIACVQALLMGAGFILVGIPAAGLLALLVLLLSIMQIPAMLISLPTILYVFSTHDSTTMAVMFTVYTLVAGSIDNILKPLLLGRGVDAPMPVILLGALGGMATGGIIGLFLGSVMLALGYQLFMAWVYDDGISINSNSP